MPKDPKGQNPPCRRDWQCREGNADRNRTRIHKTLKVTPAMGAGVCDTLMKWEDILSVYDEQVPKPEQPKTYKKRKKEISNRDTTV